MVFLVAAVLVFGLLHIVPAIPALKRVGVNAFGRAWGAVYGISSAVMLVLSLWALRAADVVPLYDPAPWTRHANFLITLVAFIFVGIFLFRGSWRNRVRHPMAIAVVLWAFGHLLANGDTRTTVFFAGFAVAAIVHAVLRARQGFTPTEERAGHNFLSVVFGVALYAIVIQAHHVIAGVPVFQLQLN